MSVSEILAILPEAEPVLAEYGLHCFNCASSSYETLEEGYYTHRFAEDQLDELVADLNELLRTRPVRPQSLEVTKDAAENLKNIAEAEGRLGQALEVGFDEAGGFCMEFRPEADPDWKVFAHREVPELRLYASSFTLGRIGGATIDFREGRFKLDLPDAHAAKTCACGGKGECGCAS